MSKHASPQADSVYKVKNLLPGDCKSRVQFVHKVSEPTTRDCQQGV